MVLAGCATKKDVKLLRDEVQRLQVRQDSLFQVQQRNYRLLLDTLRVSFEAQRDAAGQSTHRFQELSDQLDRTGESITQLQTVVSQLLERLAQGQSAPNRTARNATQSATQNSTAIDAGEVAQALDLGKSKLNEGAFTTARTAFEVVVQSHATDPRAPEAQYLIGETYVGEGDFARAVSEFEKVEQNWPNSSQAPVALLRAGILAEDHADKTSARRYYSLVIQRYPGSEQYPEATRRLRALGG